MFIPFHEDALYYFDWDDLKPGDVAWIGPVPRDKQRRQLAKLGSLIDERHRKGEPFMARYAGDYVCLRHLTTGPVTKLAEFRNLREGETIVLDPFPSSDVIGKALATASYLAAKGAGIFLVGIDGDGALEVKRHDSPNGTNSVS